MSKRFSIFSVLVLAHCLLFLQPLLSQVTNRQALAEFDHIALHVRDLGKSTQFYRDTIGLQQVADPFKDDRHVFFRLSPRTQLHLIAGAKDALQRDIDVHFALRVPSVESFRQLLARNKVKYFTSKMEEGAVTTRPDGIKQIYLQDPDGYWIEVNDSRL